MLATAAKGSVASAGLFIGLETIYLARQFGLYWAALRLLQRPAAATTMR